MVETQSPSCIETAAMETNKGEEKGKPRAPAASCEIPQRAQFLESRIVERGGRRLPCHCHDAHTDQHDEMHSGSITCMHACLPTHPHARTHARTPHACL